MNVLPPTLLPPERTEHLECPYCEGTGLLREDDADAEPTITCGYCDGDGWIEAVAS